MAKLSENTVVISDGDIKLYKRRNSSVWQAKFKINNRWVRISTDQRKLEEAMARAKRKIVEYEIMLEKQIPVVTKTFPSPPDQPDPRPQLRSGPDRVDRQAVDRSKTAFRHAGLLG